MSYHRFSEKLDELLNGGLGMVDNSEPTKTGFSLGFHLGFHGENNVALKSKLHRVYSLYCPALLTGRFLSEENIILQSHLTVFNNDSSYSGRSSSSDRRVLRPGEEDVVVDDEGRTSTCTTTSLANVSSHSGPIRVGFISRFFYNHAIGVLSEGIIQHLPRSNYQVYVFMVEPDHAEDEVSLRIRAAADKVRLLFYATTRSN